MKKFVIIFLAISLVFALAGISFCEPDDKDASAQVERDYLDLIDQHIAKLAAEYNASTETESLLVRRAVENYVVADLVDYTLLIFMAKYNVATGGIDMKRANAEILNSLKDLSASANGQMIENINALRLMRGLPPIKNPKPIMRKED